MKHAAFGLLIVCVCLWAGFGAAQDSDKEKAAIGAAEAWLSLVDSGKYGQSWSEAAGFFKGAVTKAQWGQSVQSVRDPLGKLVSRKVKDTSFKTSLPGAPDGEYLVIQFESAFANKSSAVETVTPMLEKDGKWRVSGYYVK